ncbi:hypothetical protein [Phycicoccus duodecadis]|uniref:Uncharacterized protein n=1 Tax=Phycicoccus duodecadis TaxID=173053 RepID=A0A2N3YIA2_9MICO|nr:hypothetical protein [Phycicoccus duodecadis]PKW26548.1 hypothetical protein ATL31_1361 [Phycicoccus duodecadis]
MRRLLHLPRIRWPATAAATLVACLGVLGAGGATAEAGETATTGASVTLQGGGLSISASADAGNIGTQSNGIGAVTVSGQLGSVQVTDSRGAPAGSGWTATAISTAFTQTAGPSVGAGAVGYTAGPISTVGTATYTANDPSDLTGVSAVVTATAITGDNTASWNPTIHVAFPAGGVAGVYLGTITHSVS